MRTKTSIISLSIACAMVLLSSSVRQVDAQWPNPGRKISCWLARIWYDRFEIKAYFSSRARKDVLLHAGSRYAPDDIDFDPSRGTAIIAHGFMSTGHDVVINKLRDALLTWKDINVIVLDWQRGCNNFLLYQKAAANTEFVALNIREMLLTFKDFFETYRSISREQWGPIHLIGFSLGAHVVGHAGKLLQLAGIVVDRVTGLDPAEPCFEDVDMPLRLSRDSARFVDVIHTDAAASRNQAFGLWQAVGHADFYVNGGKQQPGCLSGRGSTKRRLHYLKLFKHTIGHGSCHHARAPEIFAQTLLQARYNECHFWAHPWRLDSSPAATHNMLQNKCDKETCVEMGINADLYNYPNAENVFYVETSDYAPYCNV